MTSWQHRHAVRRESGEGERGAIIVLALAFLTVVLVLTIALIQFAFTSTASQRSFRTERVLRYAGDSALQATVLNLARNPQLATKGSDFVTGGQNVSGTFSIPIDQGATATGVVRPFTAGSILRVDYTVPSTVTSSGERQNDGGQGPREAIITVTCGLTGGATSKAALTCGAGGGRDVVVARARVRYEIDYGVNGRTGVPIPPGSRAVVPKVVWWSSRVG